MNNLIRIPRIFCDDHEDRELATPTPVAQCSKYYDVSPDDPALPELLSDAEYYAESIDVADPDDPTEVDGRLAQVVDGAKETVRAIKAGTTQAYKTKPRTLGARIKRVHESVMAGMNPIDATGGWDAPDYHVARRIVIERWGKSTGAAQDAYRALLDVLQWRTAR